MIQKKTSLSILALLCLAGTAAHAQSAGSFIARIGATQIKPDVDSGDLSAPSFPGTRIDVKKASQVTGGITYMWTDNISFDLPLGIPFKHDVVGAGAIEGVGKLGTVKSLPVLVTAQYRFGTPTSLVRPYVGAGATWVRMYGARSTAALSGLTGGTPSNPTTLSMKNAGGSALQLGLAFNLGGHWTADVNATQVFVKTKGQLSTGQTISATLDPLALSMGVGYRF